MTSPEHTQSLLEKASAALESGDVDAGEKILQECVGLDPNNAPALEILARVALSRGDHDLAETYARRAVAQQQMAGYVVTLADVLRARRKFQDAFDLYTKVNARLPDEPRTLQGMGEIFEEVGQRENAVVCYERLLQTTPDIGIAIKLSYLFTGAELLRGMAALEKVRPGPQESYKNSLGFYNHYAMYKEWAERQQRGLLVGHSSRMSDSFFNFAAAERDELERIADYALTQEPDNKNIIGMKALCQMSRGDGAGAEPLFRKLAQFNPETVYRNVTFDPSFYKQLDATPESALAAALPPLIEVKAGDFDDAPLIYLSCNYGYFVDFARPMMLSIDDVSARPQIHLHIMDGSDADLEQVKAFCGRLKAKVAVSAERTTADPNSLMSQRCYYHAIRFIRLLHHLRVYNRAIWLMDVDGVMHRDPRPLFESIGDNDIAFRARPGRWEPWNQFNASVIGLKPTPATFDYMRLICAYILHFYKRDELRWGIDQLAMFAVYQYLKDEGRAPAVHLLDDRAIDYEYRDDGFVWCSSGKGKFLQLKQIQKGLTASTDPRSAKYFDAFRKYLLQLS